MLNILNSLKSYQLESYKRCFAVVHDQIDIYDSTWCKSDFVEVTNAKLVLKPFRRDPP